MMSDSAFLQLSIVPRMVMVLSMHVVGSEVLQSNGEREEGEGERKAL